MVSWRIGRMGRLEGGSLWSCEVEGLDRGVVGIWVVYITGL